MAHLELFGRVVSPGAIADRPSLASFAIGAEEDTNNTGELSALVETFLWLQSILSPNTSVSSTSSSLYDTKSATIWTDSEYCLGLLTPSKNVAQYLIGEFPRLQIGVWLASLYGFRVKTLSKLVPNPTHGMHAIQVSLLQQNSLPSPQARMKPSHFTKICVTTLLKDSHTYTFQHFRDQDLLHHSGNRYARPSDTLPPSAELNLLNGKRASYRDYPPLHCLPQHVLEHASSYRIAVHLLLCHTPSCVPQGGSQLLQQLRLCIPLLRHPWQLHYVPKCGMVLEC